MERATQRDERGYYLMGDGIYSDWGAPEKFRGDHVDRLAAYEGTGLEPEEIHAIAGLASENCNKAANAIDKLLQDDAELKSYRDLGSIDRLRELVRLDNLLGKVAWSAEPFADNEPRDGGIIGYEVYSDTLSFFVNFDPVPLTGVFNLTDIGKTVFFTREEAENTPRRVQE